MKKRTGICLGLAVLVVLAAVIFVLHRNSAGEHLNETEISFDQYIEAVRAEYAKYGIACEVLDKNEQFVYTQALLEEQLTEMDRALNLAKNNGQFCYNPNFDPTERNLRSVASGPIGEEALDNNWSDSAPGATEWSPYRTWVRLVSPMTPNLAWADLCIEVETRENAPMDVVDSAVFQLGYAQNFVNWEQEQVRVTSNVAAKQLSVVATGLLTVQYREPVTELMLGLTSEHTVSCVFEV